MTREQFVKSKVYKLLCQVKTKLWVEESAMTEEEKNANPSYKTAEGYLKDIPFKEAFKNAWGNWDAEARKEFTELPNFDATLFEEITGVNVNE